MSPEEKLKLAVRRETIKETYGYLLNHSARYGNHGTSKYIAWNIKVHMFESELRGPAIRKEYGLKKKWDEQWEQEIEKKPDMFWRCCEDGLGFVGDTRGKHKPMFPWTTKDGDEFDYEIWQAGRSGGWMELHSFEGVAINVNDLDETYQGLITEEVDYLCSGCLRHAVFVQKVGYDEGKWVRDFCGSPETHGDEYYETLENLIGRDRVTEWLEKLAKFCRSLDEFDAKRELEHQFAFRRQEKEVEWKEEAEERRRHRAGQLKRPNGQEEARA